MEEWIIKPTQLHGMHWLPHIPKASSTLVSGYTVIVIHFQYVGEAGPKDVTVEVKGRACFLSQKLTDFDVLCFLFFLQDVLKIVSSLSLAFPKDGMTCVDYMESYESVMMELTDLAQQPGDNLCGFLDEVAADPAGEYHGFLLSHYNPNLEYGDLGVVIANIHKKLLSRFEPNQNSKRVLTAGRVFETKEWPLNREGLAPFGNDDVMFLTNHFAPLLERVGMFDLKAIRHE